jgi:SAM-dependent methyltransferase
MNADIEAAHFSRRNGFARQADLDDPSLRSWCERCRGEIALLGATGDLGWSRRWEYPFVLSNVPRDGAGRRILDAGSGRTFLPLMLAKMGYSVEAVDRTRSTGPRLRRAARRQGVSIDFSVQDLERSSLDDASMDVIVCVSVLEHTDDPCKVIVEFDRVLRPGGRLVVTFDVSVDGRRRIDVATTRTLVALVERTFGPPREFADHDLLDEDRLREARGLLRTRSVLRDQPELLPWSRLSRAGLSSLLRGSLGRPFFDLTVIGLVIDKSPSEEASRGA